MQRRVFQVLIMLLFLLWSSVSVCGQSVTSVNGVIVESGTNEPVPFAQVFFTGSSIGTTSNLDGVFSLSNTRGLISVTIRSVGYKTQTLALRPGKTKTVTIVLEPEVYALEDVVVKPTRKRERYRRKGNPAVDLIKNVIANKDKNRVGATDAYKKQTYEKLLLAMEPFDWNMDKKFWQPFQFLKEYTDTVSLSRGDLVVDSGRVQVDSIRLGEDSIYIRVDSVVIRTDTADIAKNMTSVLNFSIHEILADEYYQPSPRRENRVITGSRWRGLDQLFDNGGLESNLQAIFQPVNIFSNDINVLANRFVSPLNSTIATSFYHYFIQDTIEIEGTKCIDLAFVPVNSQSFGFTGHLYIVADSSYALKQYKINVPVKINLNWVSYMSIQEVFQQVDKGKWASEQVNTSVRFVLRKKAKHNIYAQKTVKSYNYDFDATLPKHMFVMSGSEVTLEGANKLSSARWDSLRPIPLTIKESMVDSLTTEMMRVPAFRTIVNVVQDLIQEYIPTTSERNKSKWDFGPIFNTVSYNEQEGVRLRVGGMTTANVNPHWFTSMYLAYGFTDQRFKGAIMALYSFNKKDYHPYQTMRHYLALSLSYDLEEMGQTYRVLDRDHIFMSIKFSYTPKPMLYVAKARLKYEKEWANQFSVISWIDFMHVQPNGSSGAGNQAWAAPRWDRSPLTMRFMTRQPDGSYFERPYYHDYQWTFQLRYAPGGHIYNDRQGIESPFNLWKDAPVFRFTNEMGFISEDKYFYNRLQFSVEKRFWLSAFGHLDGMFDIGYIAAEKVPFTKLFIPTSNLSILMDPKAFSLMQPMEFLMDRYASLHLTYYMKGWLFNLIPGIKHLKLREVASFHILAGYLGDRNNPAKTSGLYELPYSHQDGHDDYIPCRTTFADGSHPYMPYMEVTAGIENIFKLFRVEYVRRLTHIDGLGPWQRNGVRITIRVSM